MIFTKISLITMVAPFLASSAFAALCTPASVSLERQSTHPTCMLRWNTPKMTFDLQTNQVTEIPIQFERSKTVNGQSIHRYTPTLTMQSFDRSLLILAEAANLGLCQPVTCDRVSRCQIHQTSDQQVHVTGNILFINSQLNTRPLFYSAQSNEEADVALLKLKAAGLCHRDSR